MEKPVVLHLITSFEMGGAEKFLATILPTLSGFTHIAVGLGKAGKISEILQEKGIICYTLNGGKHCSPYSIINFYKILKKHRPQVLITYLIHADIFGRIFGKLFSKAKIICFLRSSLDSAKYSSVFLIERLTSHLVTKYFAVSQTTKNQYIAKARITGNKIIVIPNGIKLENFPLTSSQPLKTELKIPNSSMLIGTVSRLVAEKNIDRLLSTFAEISSDFPNAFLVICGDGPEKNKLMELNQMYGLANKVFFLGFRSDIARILSSLDIYCQLSSFEGMSNSIIEACISGCPLLLSNIKPNHELCTHGKNGFLVDAADPKMIAQKLSELITNQSLRKEMRQNNLAMRARFSLEKTSTLFNNEIQQVISSNS